MSDYAFYTEDKSDVATSVLRVDFSADMLDTIVEQFFWFLRHAGYTYITGITVHKQYGDITFESQ